MNTIKDKTILLVDDEPAILQMCKSILKENGFENILTANTALSALEKMSVKPDMAVLGSFLFGGLYIVYLYIPGLALRTQELIKMLPYVVTIIVLIISSMRDKKENQGPASLGLSYFREER